jgi:hypothetical protein
MTDEKQEQSNLPEETVIFPKKITELPRNYYFYGDPAAVIDRATELAKLDGDPRLQDQRQLLAQEVLNFCPVPFLDELIEALTSNTQEAGEKLRDKAKRYDINLYANNYSEEEKNQIASLALKILNEKILNTNVEQVLPILLFVQEYIRKQTLYKSIVDREVLYLEAKKSQLSDQINLKQEELADGQKTIFLEFLGKLSSSDF